MSTEKPWERDDAKAALDDMEKAWKDCGSRMRAGQNKIRQIRPSAK